MTTFDDKKQRRCAYQRQYLRDRPHKRKQYQLAYYARLLRLIGDDKSIPLEEKKKEKPKTP